jgi:hypothetical protein
MTENVALCKKPAGEWEGAYERYGVEIAALRKQLFSMLDGDAAEASLAEACLLTIDEVRDEYGRVDTEPRHPDIASGRPWPLAAAQP